MAEDESTESSLSASEVCEFFDELRGFVVRVNNRNAEDKEETEQLCFKLQSFFDGLMVYKS